MMRVAQSGQNAIQYPANAFQGQDSAMLITSAIHGNSAPQRLIGALYKQTDAEWTLIADGGRFVRKITTARHL